MRRLVSVLLGLLLGTTVAAQVITRLLVPGAPTLPATCQVHTGSASGIELFSKTTAPNIGLYVCTATNTWTQITGGSGLSVAWTNVTGTPTTLAGYGITDPIASTAPTYWTKVSEATLPNSVALGPLASGLVLNTTATGVPTIYTGTSCTNQFPRGLNASGAATCASVSLTADVTGLLPYVNFVNASGASLLLGRGSAAGAGVWQEVTLGAGLTLTGTVLSASGSGGTVTTTGSPASGNLTKFSGAASITNGDLSGNVTTSGTLVTTIGAAQVTNAMLAGSITASNLVGTDIATVGTITSGTWQGTVLGATYGGTGVNNGSKTITLGNTLTTSGNFALTLTTTGTTNVTLPTSGTLVNTAVTTLSSLVSIGTITTGVWTGTTIAVTNGGTGATTITGLVLGNGASAMSAYGGATCTNQALTALSAAGAGTCTTLTSAYVNNSIWTGTVSSGLLKASAQGTVAQATADTDYSTPTGTETFTNKTYDAEATGNVLSLPFYYSYIAAACQNATATLGANTPTSNPAVANCQTGTNTQFGTADFANSANLSMQGHFFLPSDWTGTIDWKGKWFSATTSGNVVWQVATICVGAGATSDPAFNTASTVTSAAQGTTLQQQDAAISAVTITGCSAGQELYWKISRNAGSGSDTMAGTARLLSFVFVVRRAI